MAPAVDVAIIGAGLSGLQAALDLQQAGRSFVILEARDRVGGKTMSIQRPDGKGIQEMGPAWVNDSNQSLVWAYCEKFGLTPVVQNIQGNVACEDVDGQTHVFLYGSQPKFGQAEVKNIEQMRDTIQAASQDQANFRQPRRAELDSLNLEQWIRSTGGGERAVQTARLWTHGMLGQDPCEVSALSFLEVARGGLGIMNLRSDGKHGAQYLRLKEGTSSIGVGMAKLLPSESIHLNSPVTSILRHGEKLYTVVLASGQCVTARKVIISIPGTTYKNIHFDPPLPSQRLTYTIGTRYGCYVKYIALFKSPFWRKNGGCGLGQSFRGPFSIVRDTSVDTEGNYALTCFISSQPGRKWYSLPEKEREEAILAQLSNLFQTSREDVDSQFIQGLTSPWMEDRWAGFGCPFSVTPPGIIGKTGDGELVAQPFGGIYFVGTELTDQWRGYMEGALISGKRGASQALDGLRKETSRL
ncbi:hypothetical protein G7046_g5927 [Stylonectria norvegica]|nr:hypothetical protein G7046_g5927 [Stylonectria norvegica]